MIHLLRSWLRIRFAPQAEIEAMRIECDLLREIVRDERSKRVSVELQISAIQKHIESTVGGWSAIRDYIVGSVTRHNDLDARLKALESKPSRQTSKAYMQ